MTTSRAWTGWARRASALLLLLSFSGCGDAPEGADSGPDAGGADGGDASDGGLVDGGPADGGPPAPSECDDGIDNDGDGRIDWQADLGCYGPADRTEAARPRSEEDGFTTYDIGDDSVVIYVSEAGDDGADGRSAETAVRTVGHGASLIRDGENDFLLLRRGDTWRDESLGRFVSGRDAAHPVVIASYGASTERPRLELDRRLIDHNGQSRSFFAIVGIHMIAYRNDPAEPSHDGEGSGGFRFVGGGTNLLVEDCHLEYSEIIIQSYGEHHYEDVELRRNIIEKSYHANTCLEGNPNGNAAHRPSGTYASHVDRLTIEENLYDHNGWNEDVESACATIYNHNMYLNGNDLVIRNNLLTRASSIHIKLRSDTTGDMDGLLIENNFFVEGEIGVSAGGNTDEPFRFASGIVRRNVLSDIGRSRPTTRTLAWGVEVIDNDGMLIEDNHFLNQRESAVSNSYALSIGGGSQRDVTVENNLFYRIQRRGLRATAVSGHETIRVVGNTFADPDQDSCLVSHDGSFADYAYLDNRYYSSADADSWFCLNGGGASLSEWTTASDETGAVALDGLAFSDPDRTVETYSELLGLGGTLISFIDAARRQSRLGWREDLMAPAVNDYIRAGFE